MIEFLKCIFIGVTSMVVFALISLILFYLLGSFVVWRWLSLDWNMLRMFIAIGIFMGFIGGWAVYAS